MDGLNSELVSLTMQNIWNLIKKWFVRVLKYLDHYEMVESRICVSKDVDLSNMLFLVVHFAPIWWMGKKYSKYMIFYF